MLGFHGLRSDDPQVDGSPLTINPLWQESFLLPFICFTRNWTLKGIKDIHSIGILYTELCTDWQKCIRYRIHYKYPQCGQVRECIVDLRGIEPLTSAMRMPRSTIWATGPTNECRNQRSWFITEWGGYARSTGPRCERLCQRSWTKTERRQACLVKLDGSIGGCINQISQLSVHCETILN